MSHLVADLTASIFSALAVALLILALWPLLERYALARPNARSSHATPTPQGGGVAIVIVVLLALALEALGPGRPGPALEPWKTWLLAGAILVLSLIGLIDDIRPLGVTTRLLSQVIAAGLILAALPATAHPLAPYPELVEAVILAAGLVWFINLTNFMDGIDWITVMNFVPALFAIIILALVLPLPEPCATLAIALMGGLIGFAPFNRPSASLFLGDVGSLAIGGAVGYLLLALASSGRIIAALLLAMYYLADATLTLFLRWRRGETLSEAHRTHFYQRATPKGKNVGRVVIGVFGFQCLMAALALISALDRSGLVESLCLVAGLTATGFMLQRLDDLGRRAG